jgi:hypothetical protein
MDRYPSEIDLQAVRDFTGSPHGFVDLLTTLWWGGEPAMGVGDAVVTVALVTHGWSGNEELVSVAQDTSFWSQFWARSVRGGRFEFTVPVDRWDDPRSVFATSPPNAALVRALAGLPQDWSDGSVTALAALWEVAERAAALNGVDLPGAAPDDGLTYRAVPTADGRWAVRRSWGGYVAEAANGERWGSSSRAQAREVAHALNGAPRTSTGHEHIDPSPAGTSTPRRS